MSSHDSISVVLKCMLKGAADFLIKPVRKNELRNLWQHVWRRHTVSLIFSIFPSAAFVETCSVPRLIFHTTFMNVSFLFFNFLSQMVDICLKI